MPGRAGRYGGPGARRRTARVRQRTRRLRRAVPAPRDGARRRVAELLPAQDERVADPDHHRLGEVAVPIASAFPGLLPLQRALRPVQRYRPPAAPARHTLDEPATAELSAHAETVIPVLRGVHRRAAALRLLMDGSSSMAVWEQMLHDLRQVCERVGAFRDVTVHYLHPHGPDVGVAAAPGPGSPLRPADQLHDPTGHHLTLVISDCAGPLWRDGRMQRLLYRWAADAPLAVVQPLPQRMWGAPCCRRSPAPSSAARAPTRPWTSSRPGAAVGPPRPWPRRPGRPASAPSRSCRPPPRPSAAGPGWPPPTPGCRCAARPASYGPTTAPSPDRPAGRSRRRRTVAHGP
ncbi:SAV_2336 N-terminal domain-related protein [Streptomyces lydicus]|nr:SAV_2336 N-terminal domain-related protein [Streptomyces lydicus]